MSQSEVREWRRRADAARARGLTTAQGASVSGQVRLAQRGTSSELKALQRAARDAAHAILVVAEMLEGGGCTALEAAAWLRAARTTLTKGIDEKPVRVFNKSSGVFALKTGIP